MYFFKGLASGGKRVTECIVPRGLGGPQSPTGHRDIPIRVMGRSPNIGEVSLFIITAHAKPNKANTPKAPSSAPRSIRQPCVKIERDQSPTQCHASATIYKR